MNTELIEALAALLRADLWGGLRALLFFAYANIITVIYAGLGIQTIWRVYRERRTLFDQDYTAQDDQLAHRVGFFLITPFGVFLHELGHLLTAQALGARDPRLHFLLYWGYVDYPSMGVERDYFVAVAGPLVTLILGFAGLLAAARTRNLTRGVLEGFAQSQLFLVLLFYPAISFWTGVGDFITIYARRPAGWALVSGAVHIVSIVLYFALSKHMFRQNVNKELDEMAERNPDQMWQLTDKQAARLLALQQSRLARFLPRERQELAELYGLQAWAEKQNARVRQRHGESD